MDVLGYFRWNPSPAAPPAAPEPGPDAYPAFNVLCGFLNNNSANDLVTYLSMPANARTYQCDIPVPVTSVRDQPTIEPDYMPQATVTQATSSSIPCTSETTQPRTPVKAIPHLAATASHSQQPMIPSSALVGASPVRSPIAKTPTVTSAIPPPLNARSSPSYSTPPTTSSIAVPMATATPTPAPAATVGPSKSLPLLVWVDDRPENNQEIVDRLKNDVKVVISQSTATALAYFANNSATLREQHKQRLLRVVTDRVRVEGGKLNEDAGAELITTLRAKGWTMPIFVFCGQLTMRVLQLAQAPATYASVREADVYRFANFESAED